MVNLVHVGFFFSRRHSWISSRLRRSEHDSENVESVKRDTHGWTEMSAGGLWDPRYFLLDFTSSVVLETAVAGVGWGLGGDKNLTFSHVFHIWRDEAGISCSGTLMSDVHAVCFSSVFFMLSSLTSHQDFHRDQSKPQTVCFSHRRLLESPQLSSSSPSA